MGGSNVDIQTVCQGSMLEFNALHSGMAKNNTLEGSEL